MSFTSLFKNCCVDYSEDAVYVFDHVNQALHKKNISDGQITASYPLTEFINEVYCSYFDGGFFWSLENIAGGVRVRRWYIVSFLLQVDSVFTYISNSVLTYDAKAFSVVHTKCFLEDDVLGGSFNVVVDDCSGFSIGDVVVIGPNFNSSFYEKHTIINIDEDENTLYFSTPLGTNFTSFTVINKYYYFVLFNEYSLFGSSESSLLKLDFDSGSLLTVNSSGIFRNIIASSFYEQYVIFIKGNSVVYFDPSNNKISKLHHIDNLDTNRASILNIYSVFIRNSILYRLQNEFVVEDSGAWVKTDLGNTYTFITDAIAPFVFFVELFAVPDIFHRETPYSTTDDIESNVMVRVLTQYRLPVNNKYVLLGTDTGYLDPISGNTDVNGEFFSTYYGTQDEKIVEISAEAS